MYRHILSTRSLLLGVTLLTLATLGQYLDDSGVLLSGLSLVLIFFLTKARYPNDTASTALLVTSSMAIVWGWLGPNISPYGSLIPAFFVFIWGVYCLSGSTQVKFKTIGLASAVLPLSVVSSTLGISSLLSPLMRGYDNSAHIPALSQFFRHEGFLYTGVLAPDFSFSNYVNGYPPLQQSTWAFIMTLSNAELPGGYEIIRFFFFFFVGTGMLTVSLVARNWQSLKVLQGKRMLQLTITALIALMLVFSSANFILWQGFPPFVWTCCIFLAVLNLISVETNQLKRIGLAFLGVTLVNYSYPLLSPAIFLVLIFEIFKLSRSDYRLIYSRRWILFGSSLVGAMLNYPVVIKTLRVKNYLNDDGGIQPVDLIVLCALFGTVLIAMWIFNPSFKRLSIHFVGFLASLFNFGLFAIISKFESGYISYYPAKAGYLALILGFTSLGALQSNHWIKPGKQGRVIQYFVLVISVMVCVLSVSRTLSNRYEPASTHVIIADSLRGKSNPMTTCMISAMELTADLNSNSSNKQILFMQDDLSTRWINAARGRLIDATYSLSIFVGQGQQTLPEILKWWTVQFPNVDLVILSPTMPEGLEPWTDRIEHRVFSCS